jgi:hypothetical protein
MNYDETIIHVLSEAGPDGLSIRKIVRHVYNSSNTFFDSVDIQEIHSYVVKFLHEYSRKSYFGIALVEIVNRRGVYRVNKNSPLYYQFCKCDDEDEQDKPVTDDKSLSLFDD